MRIEQEVVVDQEAGQWQVGEQWKVGEQAYPLVVHGQPYEVGSPIYEDDSVDVIDASYSVVDEIVSETVWQPGNLIESVVGYAREVISDLVSDPWAAVSFLATGAIGILGSLKAFGLLLEPLRNFRSGGGDNYCEPRQRQRAQGSWVWFRVEHAGTFIDYLLDSTIRVAEVEVSEDGWYRFACAAYHLGRLNKAAKEFRVRLVKI